jgi:hypothetical protein
MTNHDTGTIAENDLLWDLGFAEALANTYSLV